MLELQRIYWTRQALRLTYSAVILWLGVSVALAFIPKATVIARSGVSGVGDIFRGMLHPPAAPRGHGPRWRAIRAGGRFPAAVFPPG